MPASERPKYHKVKRKKDGRKVCLNCGEAHSLLMRIDGRPQRPKTCIKCGHELPRRAIYPSRAKYRWAIREVDPTTGRAKEVACDSGEHAEDLIREKDRDFTSDPVQQALLEHMSTLCRQVHDVTRADLIRRVCSRSLETTADLVEDAVDQLIQLLGGDPSRRKLISIGWDEAVERACKDMKQEGLSDEYANDLRRVAKYLRAICDVADWRDVGITTLKDYRRARMDGGWRLDGRSQKAVNARTMNKDLGTLGGFLSRAAQNGWICSNPLLGKAATVFVPTRKVRVPYLPDEVMIAIKDAAESFWMKVFIVLAYYTGARKTDMLVLEWDRDIDLDGVIKDTDGLTGAKIWIDGNKKDTPHWVPLHPSAVAALQALRGDRVLDKKVFPVRGSIDKGRYVSRLWAVARSLAVENLSDDLRCPPGGGEWLFKYLRKKANTDFKNLGASRKERMAFLGHKSDDINEKHYEGLEPGRLRMLMDKMPAVNVSA